MTSSVTLQCTPIDIPLVGPLSVQLAVVETIEFMIQKLHKKSTDKPWHQLLKTLKVKIKTIGLNTGGEQAWFCVRVKCAGLEISDVPLENMLDGPSGGLSFIILQMQKLFPGSFLWLESVSFEHGTRTVQWHKLDTTTREVSMREEKQRISISSQAIAATRTGCQEMSFCWKIVQSKEHMVSECEAVCSYLHKLKLLTPESNIHFFLNMWGVLTSSKFEWNRNKASIGQKKVSVDIQHYLRSESIPDRVRKIIPKVGTSYTMAGLRVRGSEATVKISGLAAIVPPPKDSELGTRQLNEKCNKLEILFYGPGNIPLLCSAPKETGVCPTTILKLDDYGLTLDEVIHEPLENQETISADWVYKVKPASETLDERLLEWEESDEEQEQGGEKHTILVFVMLDQVRGEESSFDVLRVLQSLRHSFVQVLCKHRTKVRKAIGTALNKLLFNVSKEDQKQEQYQTAISTISSSISRLVVTSSSQHFKDTCCTVMDVSSTTELKAALQKGLWDIATDKYDLTATVPTNSGGTSAKSVSRKRPAPSSSQSSKRVEPDGFDELAVACTPAGESRLDVLAVGVPRPSHSENIPSIPSNTIAESTRFVPLSRQHHFSMIKRSSQEISAKNCERPIFENLVPSSRALDTMDTTDLAVTSDILPDLANFDDWDLPDSSPTVPSTTQAQSTGFSTWINRQNSSNALKRMDMNVPCGTSTNLPGAHATNPSGTLHSNVEESRDPLLGQTVPGTTSFEDWLQNLSEWD